MYRLKKTMEIAGSHCLELPYKSKCTNMHGHNWIITVYCQVKRLNNHGMIIDFSEIKEIVNKLDHQNLNDIVDCNPTAENIAYWIWCKIDCCYKVDVQESLGNIATFESEEK